MGDAKILVVIRNLGLTGDRESSKESRRKRRPGAGREVGNPVHGGESAGRGPTL